MRASIAPRERMSTNPSDILASIPLRDESIRSALEDIERKLAEWAAAIAHCDYAAAVPAVDSRHASSMTAAPPEPQVAEPEAVAAVPETPADDATPDAVESPATVEAEGLDDNEYVQDEPAIEEPAETPVSRPANPDDDESVLEGLSPESAKAIKVQWRLLEGAKSLRQLVEEHKARLARGDSPRDGKKSWWSRGKG